MATRKIKEQRIKRSIHSMNKNSVLVIEKEQLILVRKFDVDENKTSEIIFNDDEVEQENIYLFENNLCVEEKTIHHLDGFSEITINAYNEQKQLIKQTKQYEYGNETINYTYDGLNLISKENCDENGKVESSEKYAYNDGILVMHESFNEENDLVLKREIVIENGIAISEKQWDKETKLSISINYSNWSKDAEPSYTAYNSEGKVLERVVRNYNSENMLIEEISESTTYGYVKLTTHYIYNELNLLLKSETTNVKGDIISSLVNNYDKELIKESEYFAVSSSDGKVLHYTDFYEYEFNDL